jgi:hypothetical protein
VRRLAHGMTHESTHGAIRDPEVRRLMRIYSASGRLYGARAADVVVAVAPRNKQCNCKYSMDHLGEEFECSIGAEEARSRDGEGGGARPRGDEHAGRLEAHDSRRGRDDCGAAGA